MRINSLSSLNNKTNFKGIEALQKGLDTFYNANAVLPTLAIETGVTLGRSYEADKRGGKIEATERFIEQGVSALVWLFGVQAIKKIGETILKKPFNIKSFDFDIGKDILRDPVKNNNLQKAAFVKGTNILLATTLATYFIGFILPKINNKIVKKIIKKNENNSKNKENTLLKQTSFEQFKNGLKKDNIAFKGLSSDGILNLCRTIETNSTARLLITDAGVVTGRCHNAKNKYKKIEGVFRDIASIYFYLFAPKHTVALLNKLTKNADINPKALNKLTKMLDSNLSSTKLSASKFSKQVLGNIEESSKETLNELFKDKKTVTLEEFLKTFPACFDKASLMTELQPVFNDNRVLTKQQASDVLNSGLISDPAFLKKAFSAATKGASESKTKFVSNRELEKIRFSFDNFIKQVVDFAQNKNLEVDSSLIKKVKNINTIKNFSFNIIGVAFAAFALGILIPKVQYAITKKLTNKDEYPGLDEYK